MHYQTQILRFQAGQRSQHSAPEGAVESPPSRTVNAGELLAILVDLNPPLSRRSRELRTLAAEAYWTSSGSVVARLRRALAEANRFLVRANAETPLALPTSGSLTCAVFTEEEIFCGQVGPGNALLSHPDGTVELFPRESRSLIPLGATIPPVIHIGYAPVEEGCTLFLATTAVAETQARDRWVETLQPAAPEALAARLVALVQEGHATGSAILVHCLPEPEAQPAPAPRRESFWPFRKQETTTTAAATVPPVAPTKEAEEPAAASSVVAAPVPAPAPPQLPPLPEPAPVVAPQLAAAPLPEFLAERPTGEEPEGPTVEATASQPVPATSKFRLHIPYPQLPTLRFPSLRLRRPTAGVWTGAARRARLRQALRTLAPGRVERGRPGKVRPAPSERTPVMAGLALGLALLVFFIAVTTYLQFGGTSRAATLLDEAATLKATAYASQAPQDWQRLLDLTEQILTLDPQNAQARAFHDEAQTAIDALENAALLAPRSLLELGPTPAPRRLVVAKDWIFVLNPTVDELLELPLGSDGQSVGAPVSVLKRGQSLLGETVAHLVDLAWMEPGPGYPDGAVMVYSEGGAVYVYEPSLGPGSLTRQRLPGDLDSGTVTLMDTFSNQLYLVERQTNQLWYYVPLNGLYDSPGRPYFADGMAPPLQNVLDFALDGRTYLLSGDGTVHVYFEGTEDRSFQVQGLPEAGFRPTVMAVDLDPAAGHLYLGDVRLGRIVVLDKRGHFLHQFRLPGEALNSLEALAVNETGTILYLVAENRLYAAPLPDFSTQ